MHNKNHAYRPADYPLKPLQSRQTVGGEDYKARQPVGNYLMDKYREWERYQ